MVQRGRKRVAIAANHENTVLLFRQELVKKLIEKDCEVFVLLPSHCPKDEIEKLGAMVIPYQLQQHGMNPALEIKSIIDLRKKLSRIQPDVVLTYTLKPNLYAGMICRAASVPYIATITGLGRGFEHGSFYSKALSLCMKICLGKANRVIFQNQSTKDRLTPQYISEEKGLLVNGSGVNLEYIRYEKYPEHNKTLFLFVGRVTLDKGIGELMQAATIITDTRDDVEFLFIGPIEDDCKEMATSNRNEKIRFAGSVDQKTVYRFMNDCDAVVVPSYHEGMCNALLEAAACGRPVIATRIPGCQEIFDEGVTGFGCNPKDADSLREALLQFLLLDRESRRRMGSMGRDKMEREFSRDCIVNSYIEELEKAIGSKL